MLSMLTNHFCYLLFCFCLSAAPPKFLRTPNDQTGVQGGVASFICQATGDPRPKIVWNKKGKKVSNQRFEVLGLLFWCKMLDKIGMLQHCFWLCTHIIHRTKPHSLAFFALTCHHALAGSNNHAGQAFKHAWVLMSYDTKDLGTDL